MMKASPNSATIRRRNSIGKTPSSNFRGSDDEVDNNDSDDDDNVVVRCGQTNTNNRHGWIEESSQFKSPKGKKMHSTYDKQNRNRRNLKAPISAGEISGGSVASSSGSSTNSAIVNHIYTPRNQTTPYSNQYSKSPYSSVPSSNGSNGQNVVAQSPSTPSSVTTATPQSTRSDRSTLSIRGLASLGNAFSGGKVQWHKDVNYAIASSKWETIRGHLSLSASYRSNSFSSSDSDEGRLRRNDNTTSFWSRLSGARGGEDRDRTGLLAVDSEKRTPLHLALTSRKTPDDIIVKMIDIEARACSKMNDKGRLPLHFGVVHRHSIEVIARLIDAYPSAISTPDSKGQSPLSYALDIAKRETILQKAPPTFWMPLPDDCTEAEWQQEQAERWGIVHWLLLSSATHPQTALSVGGKKPMLVEALFHAASPAVISLLIGASVMLLSYENKATAFAGSTLYTCITRHYPLTILMSLASQCPKDVRKIRDETGMGLVSAQYISGCFQQLTRTQTHEWKVSEDFYACFLECISIGSVGDDPAISDWWKKIEFLISFCSSDHDYKSIQRKHLLHAALLNPDVPPQVIRMLLALYPKSIFLPWMIPESNTHGRSKGDKGVAGRDSQTGVGHHSKSSSNNNSNNDRGDENDSVQRGGALPLHLAAMTADYMTRFYERAISDRETVLETILNADATALRKRYDRRLPLHSAISSGRLISTLNPLIALDETQLLQRDPKTRLYPFLQVASYNNKNDEDSFRWSCLARNQRSNAEWKGLSDRNKAVAVLKIAEIENIGRVDTCYQLLRRCPSVINLCLRNNDKQALPAKASASNQRSKILVRDSTGMGTVALHYLSWCFVKNQQTLEWTSNDNNQKVMQRAIECAARTGSLSSLPSAFDTFWTQLIFWIKRCCPTELPDGQQLSRTMSDKDERYIVHAALANSDTPPQIIELLTALYPQALVLPIPGTSSLLPIHIVAQTLSYTPRLFEDIKNESALSYVVKSHPQSVRIKCDGRLPLHIAIIAGKSLDEIKVLLNEEPRALNVRDLNSKLYPFQLMAIRRIYTPDQRFRLQYVARNNFNDMTWSRLSPQQQTKEFRKAEKNHQLDVLSCVYEMLRRNPSLVAKHFPVLENRNPALGSVEAVIESNTQAAVKLVNISAIASDQDPEDYESSDDDCSLDMTPFISVPMEPESVSAIDVDDTEVSYALSIMPSNLSTANNDLIKKSDSEVSSTQSSFGPSSGISPYSGNENPSPLLLLLSQHMNTQKSTNLPPDDVFECDASVFSTVDVMSTLSSSYHTSSKKKVSLESDEDDELALSDHTDLFNIDDDDSISLDESEIQLLKSGETDDIVHLDKSPDEGDGDSDSSDSMVTFELRRKPRLFYRKEGSSAPAAVKLTKKTGSPFIPINKQAPSTQDSVDQCDSNDDRNGVEIVSFKSLQPDDLQNVNKGSADTMWMSTEFIQAAVGSQWSADDESSLTMDSGRPTKEVPSRSGISRKAFVKTLTVSSAEAKKAPADSTLLGILDNHSQNSDDDPLLMSKYSEASPVSPLTPGLTSDNESPDKTLRASDPNLLAHMHDSADVSFGEMLGLMEASTYKRMQCSLDSLGPENLDGVATTEEDLLQSILSLNAAADKDGRSEIDGIVLPEIKNPEVRSLLVIRADELPGSPGVGNAESSIDSYGHQPLENEIESTSNEIRNARIRTSKFPAIDTVVTGVSLATSRPPSVDLLEQDDVPNSDKDETVNDLKLRFSLANSPELRHRPLELLPVSSGTPEENDDTEITQERDNVHRAAIVGLQQNQQASGRVAEPDKVDQPKDSQREVIIEKETLPNSCKKIPRRESQPSETLADPLMFSFENDDDTVPDPDNDVQSSVNSTIPSVSEYFREKEITIERVNAQKTGDQILFDKVAFKWVMVPLSRSTEATAQSATKADTNDIIMRKKYGEIVSYEEKMKDSRLSNNDMYFDKKSMRWRKKVEVSTRETTTTGTEPRHDSRRSLNHSNPSNPRHGNKIDGVSQLDPLPWAPFIGAPSRKETKRKNQKFSSASRHGILLDGASSGGRQKNQCQRSAGLTPNNRELRSQWATMFNSKTRLSCLECDQNDIEVLLLPCRHLCLCRHCIAKNPDLDKCPLCGDAVTDKLLIY